MKYEYYTLYKDYKFIDNFILVACPCRLGHRQLLEVKAKFLVCVRRVLALLRRTVAVPECRVLLNNGLTAVPLEKIVVNPSAYNRFIALV